MKEWKAGSEVIYEGETWKILWLYDNGTCEITNRLRVELVELSALKLKPTTK